MRFTPMSEQDIKRNNLLPPGEYDFEVTDAVDKQSKAGNDMIEVNIRCAGERSGFVRDYILSDERGMAKLRGICAATGLLALYERGEVTADDLRGRGGRLRLVVKEDKSGTYGPQNNVRDYLPAERAAAKPLIPAMAAADLDDEIPF